MDLADAAVRWSTVISQCDHLIAIHGRRETTARFSANSFHRRPLVSRRPWMAMRWSHCEMTVDQRTAASARSMSSPGRFAPSCHGLTKGRGQLPLGHADLAHSAMKPLTVGVLTRGEAPGLVDGVNERRRAKHLGRDWSPRFRWSAP